MSKCPVCDTELKTSYCASEWGVEEDCQECPNCNYMYEFSYGASRCRVGGKVWEWYYSDDSKPIWDEIEHAILAQRHGRAVALVIRFWRWIKDNTPRLTTCAQCGERAWVRGGGGKYWRCSEQCWNADAIPF